MKKIISTLIVCSLFLISCNSVRESAGVNRKVIDEYSVVENPPLVIPPNFNLLPPEQMQSKQIEDTDSELAKEILFGLDDNNEITTDDSLISEIIKETEADKVNEDIRENIDAEFAGEKSSINDEKIFKSEDDLNNAIDITSEKNNTENDNKIKKKKRFFFF